jgi:ATP-dependent RNA helicase SUPV3L1/SUV3
MLSITGLTLEQFAKLMEGLGYRAERGERAKVRAAPAGLPEVVAEPAIVEDPADSDAMTGEGAPHVDAAPPESAPADAAPEAEPVAAERAPEPEAEPATDMEPATAAEAEPAEMEVFYTFTWSGGRGRREQGERRGPRREGQGDRSKRDGGQGDRPGREAGAEAKPRGDRPFEGKGDRGKGKGPKGKRPPREEGPRTFEARPQRKDRIDPDNPFAAALMGFRTKE